MNVIKTTSFELAIYARGNEESEQLAVLIPGRLDSKDYINFTSHAEYLANLGFFTVAFDPPGTWDSSGGIELFNTTNYIKAVNELIEYFGNKRTLLLGHSRGGTVGILVGAANPTVIGIITIMASYGDPTPPSQEDIKAGFKVSFRDLPPGDVKTAEQKKFALPLTYFKDGERYNPISALKTCTKPKLLFYGTNDDFTTPERVKEVYDSIPEPKMIHELDSEHDYRYNPKVIREVNETVDQFIRTYF
ncbi:MAG: alpha/beta fold hydrolase [Candidatus Yanofskybacteria bacterium]|nr:alpha/beta fold hydrolase [Candidatus Yanofskybacteria bacterium]